MPRRSTAFNMGTRSNYDYQFTGYQGAANPFAQLAQVFNSGTAAEQSSTLQARHALIMGTVGNTLDLQKHQGVSDIDFSDTQRRSTDSDQRNKDLTDWYKENHPQLSAYVSGRDSRGNASVAKGVNISLQQQPAAQYLASFGIGKVTTSGSGATPPPSGNPPTSGSGGPSNRNPQSADDFSSPDTGGASQNPLLNTDQFTPAAGAKEDSGDKSPADTLAGRPEEPAESAPSGGSGTADLAEASAGPATAKTGTGRGKGRKAKTVTADDADSGSTGTGAK